MRVWRRPYGSGDWHAARLLLVGVMSAVGLCLPFVPLLSSRVTTAPSYLLPAAFVVLWQTVLWRAALVDVYLNDYGVKVWMVFRTQVIPWPAIDRAWASAATGFDDAMAIWISRTDGRPDVETPIWCRPTPVRQRNRVRLDPAEFDQLLNRLNAEAAWRRGPDGRRG